jgi:hypothetical protein
MRRRDAGKTDQVSASQNAAASTSYETWITVVTKDGTYRYWGDPDEPVPWDELEAPDLEYDSEWAEEIPDLPPEAEDDAEIPAAIAKSVPAPRKSPPARSRFSPLSLAEIAKLPPPEWLIDGLVPQDGLVVLYGEPAAGKSFLALDWALSIATGVPWLGREVKQGEVVYVYAEGVRGLTQRVTAWLQEQGKAEAPSFWTVPVAVPIPDPNERFQFVKAPIEKRAPAADHYRHVGAKLWGRERKPGPGHEQIRQWLLRTAG